MNGCPQGITNGCGCCRGTLLGGRPQGESLTPTARAQEWQLGARQPEAVGLSAAQGQARACTLQAVRPQPCGPLGTVWFMTGLLVTVGQSALPRRSQRQAGFFLSPEATGSYTPSGRGKNQDTPRFSHRPSIFVT